MDSIEDFPPGARWYAKGNFKILATASDDHSKSPSASLPAIIAAFVPSFITATAFLLIFLVIRKSFRRIYAPRTYIGVIPEKDRTPSSGSSRFGWASAWVHLDNRFILQHSSLDAYLFLRFLRTTIFICFIGSCITWPILFPVNATGGGGASQLDKLGIGNVRGHSRLYAHAVVAWLFFGFVMFLIARERMWLIGLRQAWYLSKSNASKLSSRTVLHLDPPKHTSLDNDDVRSNFGPEARRQWVVTDSEELDNLVSARNSKALQLESTEVSFIKKANKKKSQLTTDEADDGVNISEETVKHLRPLHREYYIVGKGTDKINYLRDGLRQKAKKVGESRESYSASNTHNRSAVFVEYANQSAAQRAYRGNSKLHIPIPVNFATQSRLIGVVPSQVLWGNLAMPQAVRLSKKSAANAFIAALIIFWSIPQAFVGSISNVNYLANNFEWLAWIKRLPAPILGALTGLLPPLLTSELSTYVPIFMRYIAKMSGEPTTVTAELQVQAWYYAFQLIQVFFVTALSSAATAFVPEIINQPHRVPMILADNIPKSSNFYLTYFILQGLGSSTKNILNFSDLVQYIFYDIFVNKTPRQRYNQYTTLKGISWGKLYPKFTNFIIIALVYSCISPLVLGFATVGLAMFYLSYRHNLLYVIQPKLDTKGKCYTRSLQQILTGIYVGELCLIGLFALRKATGPSVMLTVLFFSTIAYNVVMNRQLSPLEDHFPDELLAEEDEEEPLLAAEAGDVVGEAHDRSRVQHLGHAVHVPQKVIDPIAKFFEPHIYASHKIMSAFLGTLTDSDPPEYSEEELEEAYQNPSLTSKTPKIWLPSDKAGLSKVEVEENSSAEIVATDNGAWLDEKGRVQFDKDDMINLPVWKNTVSY